MDGRTVDPVLVEVRAHQREMQARPLGVHGEAGLQRGDSFRAAARAQQRLAQHAPTPPASRARPARASRTRSRIRRRAAAAAGPSRASAPGTSRRVYRDARDVSLVGSPRPRDSRGAKALGGSLEGRAGCGTGRRDMRASHASIAAARLAPRARSPAPCGSSCTANSSGRVRADVPEAVVGGGAQIGPAERVAGVERLGIDGRTACSPANDGSQRHAVDVARLSSPRGRGALPRRRVRDDARDTRAGRRSPGSLISSGTRSVLAIEEEAVLVLAVLAEALPVVGGHHHDRAVQEPAAVELVQQPPDELVRVGDLAVVRILRAVSLRRRVRRVRLVEVQEREEPRGPRPSIQCASASAAVAPSRCGALNAVRRGAFDGVFVEVEPLRDAGRTREDERRDRRPGAPSRRLEQPRERPVSGCRRKPALLRTPCCGGSSPVSSDACAGSVSG